MHRADGITCDDRFLQADYRAFYVGFANWRIVAAAAFRLGLVTSGARTTKAIAA